MLKDLTNAGQVEKAGKDCDSLFAKEIPRSHLGHFASQGFGNKLMTETHSDHSHVRVVQVHIVHEFLVSMDLREIFIHGMVAARQNQTFKSRELFMGRELTLIHFVVGPFVSVFKQVAHEVGLVLVLIHGRLIKQHQSILR